MRVAEIPYERLDIPHFVELAGEMTKKLRAAEHRKTLLPSCWNIQKPKEGSPQ